MQRPRLYDAKRYQMKILIVKLKGTTCKHLWTLILPLLMSPCGIMDLSLAFWSYKFSPLHRLIHNPLTSLFRTITTCKLLWSGLVLQINACFWSYKFSPLHKLIHNPQSSLSWTITTCKLLWSACFWFYKFSPFGIKIQKGRH